MPLSIDSALGPLPEALSIRARRAEILAANVANADTPNYKARDIDFRAALGQAQTDAVRLQVTQAGHLSGDSGAGGSSQVQYRVPDQPSLDGNTVDSQKEQSAFTENAVMYQTTLTFLNGRIKGLMLAIKGGE